MNSSRLGVLALYIYKISCGGVVTKLTMLRLKGWLGVGYFSLNWDRNPQPCAKFSAVTLSGIPADKEVSFDVCLLMCKMDVFVMLGVGCKQSVSLI